MDLSIFNSILNDVNKIQQQDNALSPLSRNTSVKKLANQNKNSLFQNCSKKISTNEQNLIMRNNSLMRTNMNTIDNNSNIGQQFKVKQYILKQINKSSGLCLMVLTTSLEKFVFLCHIR